MSYLLPGGRAGARAAHAVQLIAELVRQADTGALWLFRAARAGRRIVLDVGANEAAGPEWPTSVEYALRDLAKLRRVGRFPDDPNSINSAVELLPPHPWSDPSLGLEGIVEPRPDRPGSGRLHAPVLQALVSSGEELFELLGRVPGGMYVVALGPTNDLERAILTNQLTRDWAGTELEYQLYHSAAVRCRAFLTTTAERLPAAIQAELRMSARHLDLREVPTAELSSISHPSSARLAGHGVALGTLLGLLRLPAAAEDGPFPGMRTLPRSPAIVALDPAPQFARSGIRLGYARTSTGGRVGVDLAPDDLLRHVHVIGQPGAGKTTALVNWTTQLARRGVGFIALDFHGDQCSRVLADAGGATVPLWSIDYGNRDAVVPVNPLLEADELRFAANLAAVTDALRAYIDPRNEGFFGERAARSLSLVANGYHELGPVSILLVARTLANQELCRQLVTRLVAVGSPLAEQLHNELARLDSPDSRDLFSWLASRMQSVLGSPALNRILGTGANAVDLVELMDRPQGLLVDLGAGTLGRDSARFLLGLWLIMIREAMFTRKRRDLPFMVIVDEAHLAQFGPLASLLDEARKFGVGVVVAHQRMGQLNSELADALEADSASFLSLRSGIADAARASVRLGGWPRADLAHLPAFQAAATVNRGGIPTEPFSLLVDPPRKRSAADTRVAAERADAIRARSFERFVAPFAGLEQLDPKAVGKRRTGTEEDLITPGSLRRAPVQPGMPSEELDDLVSSLLHADDVD